MARGTDSDLFIPQRVIDTTLHLKVSKLLTKCLLQTSSFRFRRVLVGERSQDCCTPRLRNASPHRDRD